MSSSTSHPPFLISRDDEHLRLLSVYHFAVAIGLAVLWVAFYILPLAIGPGYYQALGLPTTLAPEALKAQLLTGLIIYGAQIAVIGLNGWNIRQRKHRLSCLILSCVECLCTLPLGLLLGTSAILVLRRESVKVLFSSQAPQPR